MLLSWGVLTLLSTLAILFYFYCTRNFNYWKNKGVPHEKPRFFFGNLIELFFPKETTGRYLEFLYRKYQCPYFGIYSLNQPCLVVKDPTIIKTILMKDFQSFQDRPIFSDEACDPIFTTSLGIIKSPHWKPLRSKLSPIFTSGKMKLMFVLINKCAVNLKQYINTILGDDGLDIKDVAGKYTTDVIATCAFGIEVNSFTNENNRFRIVGKQMFEKTLSRTLQIMCYFFAPSVVKLFNLKFMNPEATSFLRKAFTDTIQQREIVKNKRNDLIDILIDLKNKETQDDEFKFYGDRLVAQAVLFFGAGLESTSTTIAFILHELCINVDIQDRVRKEIKDVTERCGGLTYESLQDMKYLDMVIAEALRRYSLTAFLHRECTTDYRIPKTNLVIEKGTPVLIPLFALQSDPKYFPNPEKFDPERFNNKNRHTIPSGVYLPFGDGPRNCIGERFAQVATRLGIIHIIKNFKVERNSYTKDVLTFEKAPFLRAKGGIHLTFQPL
ncbi:hypothetical protein ILUMI_25769 [Ignelater luminosus]|uniref:Cytochrome P450 n=1 Tax=Ignelater luminosus TaxID=2038154 RepID=A0A8K0C9U7_IGNLU|nr:hypothetical protein ILUMI_25769 [Ignelater luminosus]